MKLKKVEILNFRSIKQEEVDLSTSPRILVGINETGKSNVLKALRLLSEDYEPLTADSRYALEGESINESSVKFYFTLNKDDRAAIYKLVSEKVMLSLVKSIFVGSKEAINYSLEDVVNSIEETVIFEADLVTQNKYRGHSNISGFDIAPGWMKPTADAAKTKLIFNGKELALESFALLAPGTYDTFPSSLIEPFTPSDLSDLINDAYLSYVQASIPECVYWSYDDKYLLPNTIKLQEFRENPDVCLPLKNMFELAGFPNIDEKITSMEARHSGLRTLLEYVAKATTTHIRSIWKDYKHIEVLLDPNGEVIEASVRDKSNRFEFASRSDGFKRFISFLLMISARVETKKLENTLILIDEPEISLHPSGARHLLEELIKIAEKNYLVFSTHSIFMVDRDDISRHIIVSKKDEVTSLTPVDTSNFQEEEVVYNAMGYSLFETLKSKNIIFEGRKDKKLFDAALKGAPEKYKHLKKKFAGIGLTYFRGIRDVGRIVPILELANRDYLVLSDDDKSAKDAQKEFEGNGAWLRYSEVLGSTDFKTAEDFVTDDFFLSAFKACTSDLHGLPKLEVESLRDEEGKLAAVKTFLHKLKVPQAQVSKIIVSIKDHIADNVKASHIQEAYYELFDKLEV